MRRGHPVDDDPDYCRVIVRIREKTQHGVMDVLSASGQGDNLSALVEGLLTQWLASHEGSRRPKAKGKR